MTFIVFAPKPVAPDGYIIGDKNGKVDFTIEAPSSTAQIELAKHLKDAGAIMYGAHWCGHCYEQKKLFGVQALADLPYIECADTGKDAQPDLCQTKLKDAEKQTKNPAGFPTWEINGKYYSGTQSLQELAEFSKYTGPTNY